MQSRNWQEEEIRSLNRELAIVKEERDILEKPWPSSHNTKDNERDKF